MDKKGSLRCYFRGRVSRERETGDWTGHEGTSRDAPYETVDKDPWTVTLFEEGSTVITSTDTQNGIG